MEIARPSDADKARFRDVMPDDARVEVKAMFGNLGGFVNSNMFAGLFGPDIELDADVADAQRLRELGGGPFGPVERPMGGYVTIPATEDARASEWVATAFGFQAMQPPKVKKPARSKKSA
jgi:TfoX/Sxy family transcriptional regulator of competence genes